MCFSQWLRDSWRWVAETLIHCFLVETSGWIQRCHGVRWKLPQRPECCTTPAWLLWRIRVSTHTMARGTQCLSLPPPRTHPDVPFVNRSILFITPTAQWGIKRGENGDRLLKNIYTLWKINIFQLKLVWGEDYPRKVTEVVVSCFSYFGDFGWHLPPVPPWAFREDKMAGGKEMHQRRRRRRRPFQCNRWSEEGGGGGWWVFSRRILAGW